VGSPTIGPSGESLPPSLLQEQPLIADDMPATSAKVARLMLPPFLESRALV
jgi:hypothetical protein